MRIGAVRHQATRTHNPRIKRCERAVHVCRWLSAHAVDGVGAVAHRRWTSVVAARLGYTIGYAESVV
jgi:hypothetical protein